MSRNEKLKTINAPYLSIKNVPVEHLAWAAESVKDFCSKTMQSRTYVAEDGKSGIHVNREHSDDWLNVTHWTD